MANYGDLQTDIYLAGLSGAVPQLPISFAELERRAELAMPAGHLVVRRRRRGRREHPAGQPLGLRPLGRGAADAARHHRARPVRRAVRRQPADAAGDVADRGDRDLHPRTATATWPRRRPPAQTGVPMVASTLSEDPMEDVAAAYGETPGYFQLYCPTDPEVAESLVRRAERGRLPRDRDHPRHLGHRVAPARPVDVELSAAARALPGQLLHRPGLSAAVWTPRPRTTRGRRSSPGRRCSGGRWAGTTWPGCAR